MKANKTAANDCHRMRPKASVAHKTTTDTRNSDNEGLGSGHDGGYYVEDQSFGLHNPTVDEVNGKGAEEVHDFVPTRHELLQLARYWEEVEIGRRYLWFTMGVIGSSDTRQVMFAQRRLSRIATILGKDAVDKVIEEVMQKMANETQSSPAWRAFLSGTEEERDVVQRYLRIPWAK